MVHKKSNRDYSPILTIDGANLRSMTPNKEDEAARSPLTKCLRRDVLLRASADKVRAVNANLWPTDFGRGDGGGI